MRINNITFLKDKRTNCLSVSACTTIGDYIKWYNTYGKENKLDDQRPVMKTRSANVIRKRLIDDLKNGAVIPPIVIGVVVDNIDELTSDNIPKSLSERANAATVIDGMQRTEALICAVGERNEISNNPIRVEFWVSSDSISLIYRMLVLNTGQTPWDVKRQLEVVYKPLIDETKQKVNGITINKKNDGKRRTTGGIYQASNIVELFLAFASRKELVSTPDRLADDFTRLDVIKLAGEPECSPVFFKSIEWLSQFDIKISRYKNDNVGDKYNVGMDLFTEMPSKVGFIVAVAQFILGRVGNDRTKEEQDNRIEKLKVKFESLFKKIGSLQNNQLKDFLAFDVLNEKVSALDKKKIGNAQREYFKKVFTEMIEMQDNIESLEVVWRSY